METNINRQPELTASAERRRELAIKRIKEKNDFKSHVAVYLAVNAVLVMIWAITRASYFWPIWVIVPWGVGVVMNGYTIYRDSRYTEAEIQREMQNLP